MTEQNTKESLKKTTETPVYSICQALLDFTTEELADGLELVLSENYTGKELTEERESADRQFYKITYLLGPENFSGQSEASVILDAKHHTLIQTECHCNEFHEDTFCCKHIAALVTDYLLKTYDVEAVQQSRIGQALVKKTGLPNPFLPGIMRKTDRQLAFLTKQKHTKTGALPAPKWELEPKTEQKKKTSSENQLLTVSCILRREDTNLALELRCGPKRQYVIRQLSKLLQAYSNGSNFEFSKSVKVPAGRACYDRSAQPVMDFLCRMKEASARNRNSYRPFSGYNGDRECLLQGRDLEAFLELMDGKEVILSTFTMDSEKCHIDLNKVPAPLSLKKEQYGATLSVPSHQLICCGVDWMYSLEDHILLRLPIREWEPRKSMENFTPITLDYYISDSDLPAVCTNLQPILGSTAQIACEGLELTNYIPETPQIRIYLDYPQDDMISCNVKAIYSVSGKEYSVYNRKKDRKMRNFATEQPAGEALWSYFDAFDEKSQKLYIQCDGDRLYEFLTETIPSLSEWGEIYISDALKKLRVRPAGHVNVGLSLESGKLLMSLKSQALDRFEMAELLSTYNPKRKYTRLKNGSFIVVDKDQTGIWETLADTFQSYGKKDPEVMKLPAFRALYLNEMLQNRDEIQLSEDDAYQNLIRNMTDDEIRNYPLPESLSSILRPYQADGYRWIRMLKDNGFGGILADDMGLGKTLQVLTFLLSERENSAKTLIITPASLVYNWKKEVETFTPSLTCKIIAGSATERHCMIEEINRQSCDIYVTSYDLLKRDIAFYENIHFDNEIIDEAQFIKNQNTQASKGVRLIDSSFRMALTGTPIENRLSEMWSIFDYLMPGFLYSYQRFRSDFEAPVINKQDTDVLNKLRQLVHPFILRRLKKDVLSELPDKLEEVVTVRLEGIQRKLYDARAERLRLSLDNQSEDEFKHSKIEILAELTKLRQLCCGPELFLENYEGENAKKEACLELIRQAVDGDHKVLLFSQFTTALDELGHGLDDIGISYHRLDGSVSKRQRMEMVNSFSTDNVPVFCISLKAGGTGLNLTAADIVIHYDPWWNFAAQNQATDRAHRIGQTNTVTVYQLIAEKTIEEQILNLQKSKAQLAEDILSGEGIASILINKEDLLQLL